VLTGLGLASTEPLLALVADGVDPLTLTKDPLELSRNPVHAERVRADPLTWQGGIRVETIHVLTDLLSRVDAAVSAGAVTLPVLLLHGGQDDLAPVDAVRTLVPRLADARLVVHPDDRHNILHELDRDEVAAEVADFVATVTRSLTDARETP
jgi:alpha-beta hydrolase superfamily lysophospholipase